MHISTKFSIYYFILLKAIRQLKIRLNIVLFAKKFANKTDNLALKKLSLRRLEVLNEGQDSKDWIIDVDNNCNYQIYTENLLKLYEKEKISTGVSNFGDLKIKMSVQIITQKII